MQEQPHALQIIRYSQIASYVLIGIALLAVLKYGLLSALLAGLLVYSLVHMMAPRLERHLSDRRARLAAVGFLSIVVIGALSLMGWGMWAFFQSDAGNLQTLLQRLADMIEASRDKLPQWMDSYMPADAESLRRMMTEWLRTHAGDAKLVGEQAGRAAVHILIGMVIGAMAALRDTSGPITHLPLAAAMLERLDRLSDAFDRIVYAQVRIAAINAVLTGIYLMVVLPLMGVNLPLAKSMVVVTFVAGLLPVIGNLISNTVVVVVGMSHSLEVALGSLLFLVVIHKLEYFLNARIIGGHIEARAWELLVAMLAMEAIFGLPGVVAAPVLYAYIKMELMARQLV